MFCEEKMGEDKDGVSQDTDDGQTFLLMGTQLLIGKLLLTPTIPKQNKTKSVFSISHCGSPSATPPEGSSLVDMTASYLTMGTEAGPRGG